MESWDLQCPPTEISEKEERREGNLEEQEVVVAGTG